jgi:hypothetical protein
VKNFTAKYLIDITLYRNKTQSKSFAAMSGAVETGHSNWAALTGQQNTTELGSLMLRYGYTSSDVHLEVGGPPLVRFWELAERDHLEDLSVEGR